MPQHILVMGADSKRRTYLVSSDAALTAGMEVFHSADPGQPAGPEVLDDDVRGNPA